MRVSRETLVAAVACAVLIANGSAHAANLIRGPYLQAATATGICVMVEADSTSPVTVEYGATAAYGNSLATSATAATLNATVTYVHTLKLTGLEPDTLYHYRVVADNMTTTDSTFHTLPLPGGDFRFAWMADCRAPGTNIHDLVSARIRDASPLLSLYGGDLCDTSQQGLYSAYINEFFRPNEMALIAQVPFYNSVGNHETWGQNTKAFTEAPDSASGTQDYFSFDCGDVHVLVLNFYLNGTQNGLGYAPGTPQYNFASNDLFNCTSPWKIVTCHEPAYVFGGNHTPSASIKALATNIFEKAGVDLMLSGHTHFFEHILTNKVHYLIIGSAGADLKSIPALPWPGALLAAASNYNYAVADVTYTSLTMNVYTETGALLDTFNLTKPPQPAKLGVLTPPAHTHAGSWILPSVQMRVLDAKGNALGSATNTVTISIGSNPGSGTLSGATEASAVAGIATFSNLSINNPGNGYTLIASAAGLMPVTSAPFNITFADLDSDSMADNWENDNFGATNQTHGAADDDWDNDGESNLREFIGGTSPTNTNDRFNLDIKTVGSQTLISFVTRQADPTYNAGFERHYSLESSASMSSGSWSAVTGYSDITGAGQTVIYTNGLPGATLFFRGKTWLQDR